MKTLAKTTWWVFLLLLITTNVNGQKAYEFGINSGFTGYYGDVNNEFGIQVQQLRGGIFGYGRVQFNDRLSVRLTGGYLKVVGIDSLSSSEWQRVRNLNFFANMLEASVMFEHNLLPDRVGGRRIINRTIPYIFGGAGLFFFEPKTVDAQGQSWNLNVLRTSGVDYSQYAICFPVGIGVRKYFGPNIVIGIEGNLRFTTTSWIDDINGTQSRYPNADNLPWRVSRNFVNRSNTHPNFGTPGRQRGKIDGNDLYYMIGITAGYKIHTSKSTSQFKRTPQKLECPKFY